MGSLKMHHGDAGLSACYPMNNPANRPEKSQHLYARPLGVNMTLLVLLVVLSGRISGSLGLLLLLLAGINGLIGFVFLLFERRRDTGYAGGFFLSFLLLLLIGFGMCSKDAKNHGRMQATEAPTNNP